MNIIQFETSAAVANEPWSNLVVGNIKRARILYNCANLEDIDCFYWQKERAINALNGAKMVAAKHGFDLDISAQIDKWDVEKDNFYLTRWS